MGLFRKGKTRITAKLHRADLIICTHSREGKPRLIAEYGNLDGMVIEMAKFPLKYVNFHARKESEGKFYFNSFSCVMILKATCNPIT